jgi:uroporphyrinogen III methyltransferase / synthase
VGEGVGKALKGKRVVVTRAAGQSEPLVAELRRRGAVPMVLPMVRFGLPEKLELLDRAIGQLKSFDWVIVTSQNAVRAIRERCEARKLDMRTAFGGAKIAAVGPATAEAVEGAGLHVSYVARKHLGVALGEELADEVRGKLVLLPRSDKANPELLKSLKRLGAEVVEVCAYRTLAPEKNELEKAAAVLQAGADAVLFFSPSAVQHLRESLGNARFLELSRRSVFTAIGPVTEEALRHAKVERVLLAENTSVNAVVEALTGHFTRESAGEAAARGTGVNRG